MGAVSGKVTLEDGSNLKEGEISFEDASSGRAPATLPITDGQYSGKVPVGNQRVAIYSYKEFEVPPGQPGEGTKSKRNILHSKHGPDSKETREITEAGPNNFDFKVSLAPAK